MGEMLPAFSRISIISKCPHVKRSLAVKSVAQPKRFMVCCYMNCAIGQAVRAVGRFMIALLSQATQERAAIPEEKRLPTFVYIDEAHDYFDENIELLLNTARKYNVGIVLATQNLGQFNHSLLQTVLSSTSIKYAGGLSDHDRNVLSKEMGCTPESMAELGKTETESYFSFYDKNYKSADTRPPAYVVQLGAMENRPKMSSEDKQRLLADNRARYCAPYDPSLLMGSQTITNAGIQFELDAPKVL